MSSSKFSIVFAMIRFIQIFTRHRLCGKALSIKKEEVKVDNSGSFRMDHLTKDQRASVVEQYYWNNEGLAVTVHTHSKLSRNSDSTWSTVKRWIKIFKETKEIIDLRLSGHPYTSRWTENIGIQILRVLLSVQEH